MLNVPKKLKLLTQDEGAGDVVQVMRASSLTKVKVLA
jgi:hypothetical protein